MDSAVEIPIGSLVGLCVLVLVVGVILGRSGRFMRKMGEFHARAHSGDATAVAGGGNAEGGNADQRVQTVVVVGRDEEALYRDASSTATGRVDQGRTRTVVAGQAEPHQLVAAREAVEQSTVRDLGGGIYELVSSSEGWDLDALEGPTVTTPSDTHRAAHHTPEAQADGARWDGLPRWATTSPPLAEHARTR